MSVINILHLSSNKGLIKGYKTVTSFDFTQHPYVGKSTPMVVWLHAKRGTRVSMVWDAFISVS